MRLEGNACSVRDVGWQIEDCIAVVVFRDLDKILCTSIREQVHPFFGLEHRSREVLDEVVVHDVFAIGL